MGLEARGSKTDTVFCHRDCKNITEAVDAANGFVHARCLLDDKWRLCGHNACEFTGVVKKAEGQIKDSGERTQFSSGAVRDMHSGKGDMVSIPWEAILRLSRHYEAGAQKYERWNYRKGINLSSYIDSACRHLAKYQCGCDDEDHLSAAAFNILGAMLVEELTPELIDLPMRSGKNRFCYFDAEQKEGNK